MRNRLSANTPASMPDNTNDTARHARKAIQIMGPVVMRALSRSGPAWNLLNPKPEARNPKEGRKPKAECQHFDACPRCSAFGFGSFGFPSGFGFRASDLLNRLHEQLPHAAFIGCLRDEPQPAERRRLTFGRH